MVYTGAEHAVQINPPEDFSLPAQHEEMFDAEIPNSLHAAAIQVQCRIKSLVFEYCVTLLAIGLFSPFLELLISLRVDSLCRLPKKLFFSPLCFSLIFSRVSLRCVFPNMLWFSPFLESLIFLRVETLCDFPNIGCCSPQYFPFRAALCFSRASFDAFHPLFTKPPDATL